MSRITLPVRHVTLIVTLCVAAFWRVGATEPTAPARPALHIARESAHAALFRKLYAQMPDFWKSRHRVHVVEVSDRVMDRLVRERDESAERDSNDDSEVEGFYESSDEPGSTPTITLRESLDSEEAGFVFTHEYGHLVWDERLTDDDRGDYMQVWRRQRRTHSLVSRYAGDSVEEGFAEAFAYRLRAPERLHRRDPESEAFLQYLLDAQADHA